MNAAVAEFGNRGIVQVSQMTTPATSPGSRLKQPISPLRLVILVVLLLVELALVASLRYFGWDPEGVWRAWVATGQYIRVLVIAIAILLPFVMTAILLYRIRIRLGRGQFSLRAIMAFTFVVASYLALLQLFEKPNMGPLPISQSVTFEIFKEKGGGTGNELSFCDPDTGTTLLVAASPTITATDVSTVQLIAKGDQDHTYWELDIVLKPAGGTKFLQATTAARGSKLVVVLDGEVVVAANIISPVSTSFRVTGGGIQTEGPDIFNKLTSK